MSFIRSKYAIGLYLLQSERTGSSLLLVCVHFTHYPHNNKRRYNSYQYYNRSYFVSLLINASVSLRHFSFLYNARQLIVFYQHAFLCNCSYIQCNRKIAESLRTRALLVCCLWVLRSIHIASLPSDSQASRGNACFACLAA